MSDGVAQPSQRMDRGVNEPLHGTTKSPVGRSACTFCMAYAQSSAGLNLKCSASLLAGKNLGDLTLLCIKLPSDLYLIKNRIQRHTNTGVFVYVSTLFVTLPSKIADSPLRPCDAITIRSQPRSVAAAMMA